jgi:transketolase
MEQRVIYVMTHDSIGLGEDGPTHQPVEHLASLRAMPNLNVFRPADTIETMECWQLALETRSTPSVLALTRQGLPQVRLDADGGNLSARGGYVLREARSDVKAVLVATGSEVALAIEARDALEADGIGTRVVSLPCWELFQAQDSAYRDEVLGDGAVRVGIEAACGFGWSDILGADGTFIGMSSFGASAPAGDLFMHFGITANAVVAAVKERV